MDEAQMFLLANGVPMKEAAANGHEGGDRLYPKPVGVITEKMIGEARSFAEQRLGRGRRGQWVRHK